MHHPTDRITHTTAFVTPVMEHWLEWELAHEGSIRRPIAPLANALTTELHLAPKLVCVCISIILSNASVKTSFICISHCSGARCSSVVREFAHGTMDRCNDPSWWAHIKEPLLIGKSSPCSGGSGFPLSLSEWSFTVCLMPYNHKQNVLSASLNKTFPSFPCTSAFTTLNKPLI